MECLSKAHKQLAKFIADKVGEEKKYGEDINAEAQSEEAAANENCRSKCDGKYSELNAKVEALNLRLNLQLYKQHMQGI